MPEAITTLPTKQRRPMIIVGVVFIAVLALAILTIAGYLFAFKNRVMLGVSVNGIKLGSLTKEAANAKLNAAITIYENSGLNFTDGQKTATVNAVQIPDNNPDAAHQILSVNDDAGLQAAMIVGHSGNLLTRLSQAMAAFFTGKHIVLGYTLDAAGFKASLRSIWGVKEKPVNDARLAITTSGDTIVSIKTIPDNSGFEFDYDRAISDLRDHLATLNSTPIKLEPARTNPTVKTADAEAAKPLAPQALALAPLPLTADELSWTLSVRDLSALLEVYLKPDRTPSLRINPTAARAYFQKLAVSYDILPANTKYEVDPTTQKMTVFEAGKDGRKIDIDQSVAALDAALAKQLAGQDGKTGFNLVAVVDKSQLISQSAADLGITEIIGVGQSDFSGSSGNRIKNVAHGSSKLNGILIAPNQEFSAINALNPVTIEDGYFPEQIILGDKIQPAVGGGLCQIGTTLFRMAMNTGLPITERQNHSLVVHYYSDPTNGNPGTDATLYGPHPDLRFINNTGHWMLLTTDINVKTKKLTYTLWGTPDGRHGSYTPPKVTGWIAAPTEIQQIADPTLPIGQQKCQAAFRGANTTFAYTIVNADGTVTQRDFASHYRALPKICANGTGTPGTVLPDGKVVPPLPVGLLPIPTGVPAPTPVAPAETMNNINLPPEAATGN